jgi:hypothetical protein
MMQTRREVPPIYVRGRAGAATCSPPSHCLLSHTVSRELRLRHRSIIELRKAQAVAVKTPVSDSLQSILPTIAGCCWKEHTVPEPVASLHLSTLHSSSQLNKKEHHKKAARNKMLRCGTAARCQVDQGAVHAGRQPPFPRHVQQRQHHSQGGHKTCADVSVELITLQGSSTRTVSTKTTRRR